MSNADHNDVIKYALAFLGGSVMTFTIQSIWSYISRPRLELVTEGNAGLLVKSPGHWKIPGQALKPEEFFFLRMLVRNTGWRSAKSCMPYISKLVWIDQKGNEEVFKDKDLIEMQWSWRGHGPIDIPREAHQYIDLFKYWKSNLGSSFCSERFPSYLEQWGAGGGQLYIFVKVCCDSAKPVDDHVHFTWGGTWEG
jgi:hypothetical protein